MAGGGDSMDADDSPFEAVEIPRKTSRYENMSQRFHFNQMRNFQRQYAHVYAQRLITCRERLYKCVESKWGNSVPCKKLFELVTGERCIIIGTIYKDMPLKPNVLRELTEEYQLAGTTVEVRSKYTSPDDVLILEDELQRIILKGDAAAPGNFVTGIVIAVLGMEPENQRGKFVVEDVVSLGLGSSPSPPLTVDDDDRWVCVVSGLAVGGTEEDRLALQLLVDQLSGALGCISGQREMANIIRLVIAGNSITQDTMDKLKLATQARYLTRKATAGSVGAMSSLDDLLSQLVPHIPVDIMPGDQDPTGPLMPQQPLHKVMFPKSGRYETFQTVSNPYAFKIDERLILATSGQNVDELFRYADIDSSLDRMERTLQWGHLAPTCPDTLGCYPYHDRDPFILTPEDGFGCPSVYLCANQNEFAWRRLRSVDASGTPREVLLVSVPRFQTSSTCVLINPYRGECRALKINSPTEMDQQ